MTPAVPPLWGHFFISCTPLLSQVKESLRESDFIGQEYFNPADMNTKKELKLAKNERKAIIVKLLKMQGTAAKF
jgi:hypothetical protein